MHPDRMNNFTPPAGADCPSLMDLAAYLDGRASESQTDAIELHLAGCSTCLESVREFRAMHEQVGESFVLVPSRVLENAMALVPAKSVPQWWVATRRAAAIAAMLTVCAVGYQVGAQIAVPSANATLEQDAGMFFGLLEEDDELTAADDLLSLAEGEVS